MSGFVLPANRFFRRLLHEYDIQLHHLNPNGIQDIATFVAICEGYLRIPPPLQHVAPLLCRDAAGTNGEA